MSAICQEREFSHQCEMEFSFKKMNSSFLLSPGPNTSLLSQDAVGRDPVEINCELFIILGYRLSLAAGNNKVGADFIASITCVGGDGQKFLGAMRMWMGAHECYMLLSWVFFCFE